jgi:hypothetical protein
VVIFFFRNVFLPQQPSKSKEKIDFKFRMSYQYR